MWVVRISALALWVALMGSCGYYAWRLVPQSPTPFRIAALALVGITLAASVANIRKMPGRPRRQRPFARGSASLTVAFALGLNVAIQDASPAWQMLGLTGLCSIFLFLAFALPFSLRETARREAADREWAEQRHRFGG